MTFLRTGPSALAPGVRVERLRELPRHQMLLRTGEYGRADLRLDIEHVPLLLTVPGVISVTRYVQEPFEMVIGGETRQVANSDEPKYAAVYEIDSPEVLASKAWADAVDQGRWPTEVRPYTSNRRHTLQQVVDPSPS